GFEVGKEDGIFGARTSDAVAEFQLNVGEPPDGIVGPGTLAALERLRPAVAGPSRAVVREAEDVSRLERSLAGSRIAIDPGHGPDDPGNVGPGGLVEAEATLLLATDLADRLAERGAEPTLLRRGDERPTPSDRALAANALGADLCVSLHFNAGDPSAEGATCFYYGTAATHSPAGRLLAELILEELTTRLGLTDGRTHPLAVAILRETRMPAVQVEPCFLTNPREERLVADPASRGRLAAAIRSDGPTHWPWPSCERPACPPSRSSRASSPTPGRSVWSPTPPPGGAWRPPSRPVWSASSGRERRRRPPREVPTDPRHAGGSARSVPARLGSGARDALEPPPSRFVAGGPAGVQQVQAQQRKAVVVPGHDEAARREEPEGQDPSRRARPVAERLDGPVAALGQVSRDLPDQPPAETPTSMAFHREAVGEVDGVGRGGRGRREALEGGE